MARPREFDIDQAVENAMNVFWIHGYSSTRLPDLLDGMGISRGSLYKAFGSKKTLFLKSLDLYDKQFVAPAIEFLTDAEGPSGLDRIALAFQGAIDPVGRNDRRGCLLCNTAAGDSFHDQEIADIVNGMIDRLTDAFRLALIVDSSDPDNREQWFDDEAKGLTLAYVGLRVLVRSGAKENDLRQGATQTLANFRAGISAHDGDNTSGQVSQTLSEQ